MSYQYENIVFKNRKDAAEQLGNLLIKDYKNTNALVLGIPRGGVEIAYHIAEKLNCSWSVILSKKIALPGFEKFGAVSEEDSVYISGNLFPDSAAIGIIEKQKKEISKRVSLYRGQKPLPSMRDRVVILVNDGISTGVSFIPVIRLCRQKEAAKIIVASPVAAPDYNLRLNEADEITIVSHPDFFYGVQQVYQDFNSVSNEEVFRFIKIPGFEKGTLSFAERNNYR